MTDYDPKIIQEYADHLLVEAKNMIPMHFFIGILSGMIIFAGITAFMDLGFDFMIISIGVLVGAVLGHSSGKNRAFELRLQAHTALCQMRIEENTRKR